MWAEKKPNHVFLAERDGAKWRIISYRETYLTIRKIAAALLSRNLGPDRTIALLSGNSIDHALITLAAQYVGIPTTPISEQYSLIPGAHHRLQHVLNVVKPAMTFALDAKKFAHALALDDFSHMEVVASKNSKDSDGVTPFENLLKIPDSDAIDRAHELVGPDTIAKYLFTSGSTSQPKGVVTTQRMMCANQAQLLATWPFLKRRPPRLVDWLPWNHVAGGSNNFNTVLANGGSLYIDEGRPTDVGFQTTVRNIREIGCTLSFNVPIGYAKLAREMESDKELREAFFGDLDVIQYAGASLPEEVWEKLRTLSIETKGREPHLVSSWGMTETAPASLIVHEKIKQPGVVGVPMPDMTVKLIPDNDMRCEIRLKGPNVLKSYLNDPTRTKEAFDDEGFLITGDAVRFVDIDNPSRGFRFDGRISEDFKLLTGTWVQVSRLRLAVLEALSPLAADIVVTGSDREEIGVLIFPSQTAMKLAGEEYCFDGGAIICREMHDAIQGKLQKLATSATGSSSRVCRALVMSDPPSLGNGEMTDKGSLNQNKVLMLRADLVKRLYNDDDEAVVLSKGRN